MNPAMARCEPYSVEDLIALNTSGFSYASATSLVSHISSKIFNASALLPLWYLAMTCVWVSARAVCRF